MGSNRNKLLLEVRSQPIIAWTLLAAEAASAINWIGIISQPTDWPDFKAILADLKLTKPVEFIQAVLPGKNQFTTACKHYQQPQSKY